MADSRNRKATFVLGRPIGEEHPPFIIAALDCSKLTNVAQALQAVDIAAASYCDAVKLTSLPMTWCARAFNHADARGVKLLTPVTDELMIERFDWLGTSAFEIFFDWADLDLVAAAASRGKPLVLSVANANETELAEVVALARSEGATGIALVQRVLGSGLDYLDVLRRHQTVIGISESSTGPGVVCSAIGRGARIIEKRISLRALSSDLAAVVRDCEHAWALLEHADHRWTTN